MSLMKSYFIQIISPSVENTEYKSLIFKPQMKNNLANLQKNFESKNQYCYENLIEFKSC